MARNINKMKLGAPGNPIHAYKNWLTFTAEIFSILTFVMLAIIFFAGIAVAVKLSAYVNKVDFIIDKLRDYVDLFIETLKREASALRDRLEAADIPQRLKMKAEQLKTNVRIPGINRLQMNNSRMDGSKMDNSKMDNSHMNTSQKNGSPYP